MGASSLDGDDTMDAPLLDTMGAPLLDTMEAPSLGCVGPCVGLGRDPGTCAALLLPSVSAMYSAPPWMH